MTQLIGFLSNDDQLTGLALAQAAAALAGLGAQGWGAGWLQEGRALLRKVPGPSAREIGLGYALGELPARALLAQVYGARAEAGPWQPEAVGPWRHQQWLYAQRGAALGEQREVWSRGLPSFLSHDVIEERDDAVMCRALLHSLHAHDVYHGAGRGAQRAQALARLLARVSAQRGEEALARFGCVALSERFVMATDRRGQLQYRVWRGIEEPAEEALFPGQRVRPTMHPYFKALLLVSAPAPLGEGWTPVAPGTIVWASGDCQPQLLVG